jgi:hypothetical protein
MKQNKNVRQKLKRLSEELDREMKVSCIKKILVNVLFFGNNKKKENNLNKWKETREYSKI